MAEKINMTLDDIIKNGQKKIKAEKVVDANNANKTANDNKARSGGKTGGQGAKNNRKGPPAKNAKIALANKVLKRSRAIAARGVGAKRQALGSRGKPMAAAGLSAVATKKLVNKLVKNAIRKRINITTNLGICKRGGVAASTLAARRTAAIRRNVAAARGIVQPVQQRPKAPRTIIQHVQPAPVRVVRQIITAPPTETHVIRRAPPQQVRRAPPQQVRRVQQQQQRRVVVVQPVQQGRRFRPGNNNSRRNNTVIRRQVPQYEQVVQRVIQVPVPQQRFQQQQQQSRRFQQQNQRFQRPQQSGGNVRYGGGRQVQRKTVVRQVQPVQYRPVQYVSDQAVTSRGRGFRA